MKVFYSPSTRGFYRDDVNPVIPEDRVEIAEEQRQALLAAQVGGKIIVPGADGMPVAADPPAPTTEQQRRILSRAVQAHLDATARASGYDDIVSAVSYAGEAAVPAYRAEGIAFRAWRSRVWAAATAAIDANTSLDANALVASLPAYVAPASTK